MYFSYKGFLFKELSFEVAKGYSNATVKSIGFQILLRTKYVPSLVKIHLRMLILECSQGCYAVKIWPGDIDHWPNLKRIWNPIDFQGQRSTSQGLIFRRGDKPRFALPLLILFFNHFMFLGHLNLLNYFIGSYKSNHHMMTTLISPDTIDRHSAFNAVGNHKTKEGVKRSFLNSTHNLR
jgi:hypothetical protein